MAKKIVLIIFIVATVFSVVQLSTSVIGTSTPPPDTVKAETPSPLYTVKTYGDIIGIFHYGEDIPFRLLSVSTQSLPSQDIESLNKGISIYSDEDLFNIIEDFDS